jgi:hypothetical protein
MSSLYEQSNELQKTVIYEHHPQKQEKEGELVRIYLFLYRKSN